MPIYWGDLHNHCGISYGYGSLANALEAARGQLDFCAVTGHAMWPDMPPRQPGFEFVVDFHERGFAKLAAHWEEVLAQVNAANIEGEFVTFQSYEMHSRAYGDHHILSPAPDLPLVYADSPAALLTALGGRLAIAIPHHVAYVPDYRGIIWERFDETISPLVEVYSKHGCGMADQAPYPYLHTMGPRDGRTTVRRGLALGHRFGYTASTDHHAGYPGSYGDGRVAVLAPSKTRQAIWEALLARRAYAVTGDKIACRFELNGFPLGSELAASRREIVLEIRACDALDRITLYKNNRPWRVVEGPTLAPRPCETYKVRLEMGWGWAPNGYLWEGDLRLKGGELLGVETCFRGRSVLAPSQERAEDETINALENRILSQSSDHLAWRCTSFQNYTTLHPATAALILEMRGDERTTLQVTLNGVREEASLGELLEAARGVHIKPYNAEAFLLHRAVPEWAYRFYAEWVDDAPQGQTDVYDAEVRQVNGQYAWLSPVFVEK
ncbi:MAG: hypothetical protein H5T66_02150 [Chloroflexi bacterium]|nr:hypothetical protein [Chloroflexota bacterium]